ncbi:DUF7146 domain-containing protein (plasmid) [Aureimonas ureilytica]|uniref:DUF7146 domain-containing protein n=1 Tax=Aureimonas ureilytica TaxID=401562 RepID=UPI003CF70835
MRHEPLGQRALGKWRGILPAIGVPSKALTNRHGPCPMCGGKDRFRFDDKDGRGTWICSQCGAGDGIELVKQFQRVDFKEAARLIEQHIGCVPVLADHGRQMRTDAQKRQEMIELWSRSRPIQEDDIAGRYLRSRVGSLAFPANLRFAPDERYLEQGRKPSWHPMMVAKVDPSDAAVKEGQRAALHRTYLSAQGGKADVSSPRKMMGSMPSGAAVRLHSHEDVLGIAEGIETALSASAIWNVPCWAALTADLLEQWTPPDTVRSIFIFGDNDASNTGQAAAFGLARRLKAKGLEVYVELPPIVGQDWNDVFLADLEAA